MGSQHFRILRSVKRPQDTKLDFAKVARGVKTQFQLNCQRTQNRYKVWTNTKGVNVPATNITLESLAPQLESRFYKSRLFYYDDCKQPDFSLLSLRDQCYSVLTPPRNRTKVK